MQNRQSSRLSEARLQLFMAILVQNEGVFEHFKGQLTVEHFDMEWCRLLYRVVFDHYTYNSELPRFAELESGLKSYFEEDPDVISEGARDDLELFLDYAYLDASTFADDSVHSEKLEKFAFRSARIILMRFEKQKLVQAIKTEISLDELPFLLQATRSQMEIIQLSGYHGGATLTFDANWDKKAARMSQSTGLGFLDKYLGGGTSAGECYGVMAPYGTCKTTLAVMLWCSAAQQCYEQTFADDWDQRKGLSVLVTYEAPMSPEIQRRSLMYACQVNRYSLDKMSNIGLSMLLSDPEKPQEYEKRLFARAIADGVFKPERTRVQDGIVWLNEHTLCLDFSGADKRFIASGGGGVSEIVQRITTELRSRNGEYYTKNVIIDYLGLMVDRDLNIKAEKYKQEDHKTYQQANERISKEICKHFDCHAWVFHQLSGTANAMLSPTKTLHHTDAKGSKSFAENLDFAFVFGNLNHDSMGQVACTKHRHFRKLPPTVIQVDGEFNLVVAPDNFHIDTDGKIVDKDTMKTAGQNALDNFDDLQPNVVTPFVNFESASGNVLPDNDDDYQM